MADSPESPLSSHASSEFTEDVKLDYLDAEREAALPPSKRQKLDLHSYPNAPIFDTTTADEMISSDSEGSAPSSPTLAPAGLTEEDHAEQVTICKWRGCNAGDKGDMDTLVDHIHDRHITNRQKKYVCEWESCSRMDANHASGYALRAHMRSHTREKPFYCALPECDRAFTRSDALAKHMRTVHETEALRPSDPVPRNHSLAQVKPQRLKLIVNARPSNGSEDSYHEPADPYSIEGLPDDLQPTEEEEAMTSEELYRLLRRRVAWSEQSGTNLEKNIQDLEKKQREEWNQNQLVVANLVEAELATAYHASPDEALTDIIKLKDEMLPATMLPIKETPWYRQVT